MNQQTLLSQTYQTDLLNQAIAKVQINELSEALSILGNILKEEPSHFMALAWCGVVQSLKGEHLLAIEYFEKAYALSPFDAQIISNLGQSYMAIGLEQRAKIAFEKAFYINDKDAEASYYLGFFAEQNSDFDKATYYYKNAIEHSPYIRNSYVRLANIFHLKKNELEAFHLLRTATKLFPDDKELLYIKGQFTSKTIAGWHLPMLADKERNIAYEKAILSKVKPDDIVLDIGTGSGLLAMMAARAGAKHVYACEANPILADLAREIIISNGYRDKITIIPKHSSQIIIGEDMPEKADLIITEIFDCGIIGEEVLQTIDYAQKNLIKMSKNIIPQSAILYGRLTHCPHLQQFHKAEIVNGFDLTPMAQIAHPLHYKDAQINFETSKTSEIVSEDFLIQKFDFRSHIVQHFISYTEARILKTSLADSVLLHFELELAEGIIFSSKNTKEEQHWKNPSQILLEPKRCLLNEEKRVRTEFNGYFDFSVG